MTQPELFEDVQTRATQPRRRAEQPVFVVRRFSWSATAPQLALAAAVVIVLFVAAFALGVEQGKRSAQAAATRPIATAAASPLPLLVRPTGAGILPQPAVASTTRALTPPRASPPAAHPRPAPAAVTQHYTIQLATYTNREDAERQLAKLKHAGYSAYINEGHQRVSLCVGSFPTRAAATKQLPTFRKKFRDCFVRLR